MDDVVLLRVDLILKHIDEVLADVDQIYSTATRDLPSLREAFIKIRDIETKNA